MSSEIGVVGAGLMGTVMARRLITAGFPVAGYDVRAEALEGIAKIGGRPSTGIADIARTCIVGVISVFDTAQVEDVVEGPVGVLSVPQTQRTLKYLINTSTCDPDRVAALAERAAQSGLRLVELPISGTSEQVSRGDGFGLVAGAKVDADGVADIIAAICPRSAYVGTFGNGAKTKLAINLILGLNRASLAEGLVFAQRMGLPLEAFLDAAKASAAYSQIMDVKGAKMIAGDFSPHGKVAQSAKDFGLILAAGASRAQKLPLAEVYADLMEGLLRAGEGDLDNAAVIKEIGRRLV